MGSSSSVLITRNLNYCCGRERWTEDRPDIIITAGDAQQVAGGAECATSTGPVVLPVVLLTSYRRAWSGPGKPEAAKLGSRQETPSSRWQFMPRSLSEASLGSTAPTSEEASLGPAAFTSEEVSDVDSSLQVASQVQQALPGGAQADSGPAEEAADHDTQGPCGDAASGAATPTMARSRSETLRMVAQLKGATPELRGKLVRRLIRSIREDELQEAGLSLRDLDSMLSPPKSAAPPAPQVAIPGGLKGRPRWRAF